METTHIDTLHIQAPSEAAQQMQLRLSTTLSGADLHPPGLAPAQVLLVRELSDPEPGCLGGGTDGTFLDRTWERAVREALTDCLHRAVRPTNGHVPPEAEAVLFVDAAEAWACWAREQVDGGASTAPPWWLESLETSSEVPASPAGRSPSVAAVWRARPRLVPAMAVHLAVWDGAAAVVGQMTEPEAETVLQAVCTAFGVPMPVRPQGPAEPAVDDDSMPRSTSSASDDENQVDEGGPDETAPDTKPVSPRPPWTSIVNGTVGGGSADALIQHSPLHRQLLGVALALHERPTAVRSSDFQTTWQAWRTAVAESSMNQSTPQVWDGDGEAPAEPGERSSEAADPVLNGRKGGAPRDREGPEQSGPSFEVEGSWDDPYTATDLGGVFYLVNVLNALDLPAAAEAPPVGEHVGAWAILEALARTLLGPDTEALCPDDPLWRVLATLDGRRPNTPAGRSLDEETDSPEAYRMPPTWLAASHIDGPVDGQWAVTDDRLRVWTGLGCVSDQAASDDLVAQAEAEWARLPNTGRLRHAESAAAMPEALEPDNCAPALARWAARTAPYLRSRLAAALDTDTRDGDWVIELLQTSGRLYTTDTYVDLVLPLDAAHFDARVAGLDRSPGWWPPGGRVVRFHFRETDL